MNREHFKKALINIGQLFFPPVCIFCGLASDKDICDDCKKLVIREDLKDGPADGVYSFGTLLCYARYAGAVKEVVARYKFHGEMWLGRCIGNVLWDSFREDIEKCDAIVYVPVSYERRKQRGFDQCAEIAGRISKLSGVPVYSVIENISGNRRQSKLKRDIRKDTVTGRFALKDISECPSVSMLTGSRVMLIDDIMTTGSTLRECAGLLVNGAGAGEVDAMVFATGRTDI